MPIAIIDVVAAAMEIKDKENIVYDYFGLNHFGWFTSIEYKGKDLMEPLRAYIKEHKILMPAAYLKDKAVLGVTVKNEGTGTEGNRHTKGSWYYVWKGVYEIIMIETPSSVFVAEELAKLVDFFSVGTNDLTQYTLACDRQANDLGKFYDPHHPALLRAIKMAADAAHKAGIWIGICGELGADISMLPTFLAMASMSCLSLSQLYCPCAPPFVRVLRRPAHWKC